MNISLKNSRVQDVHWENLITFYCLLLITHSFSTIRILSILTFIQVTPSVMLFCEVKCFLSFLIDSASTYFLAEFSKHVTILWKIRVACDIFSYFENSSYLSETKLNAYKKKLTGIYPLDETEFD